MDKTVVTANKLLELAAHIPVQTLGRLLEAVRSGVNPHPLLLTCSDSRQYESLAVMVELLAAIPHERREEILSDLYMRMKLLHTGEKL